nr:uncharacterized protein CCDC198 [Zootoca vivipara]
MGSNSSKAHRKVTKVAPMPMKEERPQLPSRVAVYTFQSPQRETSRNAFASWTERNPALDKHLPPLREMGQGAYPTGKTTSAEACSATPEDGSRRAKHHQAAPSPKASGNVALVPFHVRSHQMLLAGLLIPFARPTSSGFESFGEVGAFILAKDIPADRSYALPCGGAAYKAKEQDKGGKAVLHPAGSRQYLLKMKMLEQRKEAELKRCLQQEARLNKPKARDLSISETPGCVPGNNSSEDEELLALESDQTFDRDHDDRWSGEFPKELGPSEPHQGQRGKVETWLLKQQARRESFWDASSTDSENWEGDGDLEKPRRRPALVRTKTERIALFDEFFDREF